MKASSISKFLFGTVEYGEDFLGNGVLIYRGYRQYMVPMASQPSLFRRFLGATPLCDHIGPHTTIREAVRVLLSDEGEAL